jgi:hypothetical protein
MDYWDMFTEFEQARAKRELASIFLYLHLTSIYLFVSSSICFCTFLSHHLCILTLPLFFFSMSLFLYPSICPSLHFSIYLPFYLSVFPSLCLSSNLSFHLSVFPYLCLSISLSFHFSVFPSLFFTPFCLSISLSFHLPVSLSLHLSSLNAYVAPFLCLSPSPSLCLWDKREEK